MNPNDVMLIQFQINFFIGQKNAFVFKNLPYPLRH